jgi:hypothetical protein
VHSPQTPSAQTRLVPHDDPSGAFEDSMQTGAPLAQTVFPTRHGLPTKEHAAPLAHEVQSPLALHTLSCPHEVPEGTATPVSTQTGEPFEQPSDPVWHGFGGTQASPVAQALHVPF